MLWVPIKAASRHPRPAALATTVLATVCATFAHQAPTSLQCDRQAAWLVRPVLTALMCVCSSILMDVPASGKYQPGFRATACFTTSATCAAGTYQSTSPSSSVNRICTACNGKTNYQDVAGQTSCKTATVCSAGQYTLRETTQLSNRVCSTCLTSRDCKTGEYLAGTCGGSSRPLCRPCHGSCASCNGPNSNQCRSCPSGSSLQSGSCVSDCSSCTSKQYCDANKNCQACHSTCASCSGAGSNQCTACDITATPARSLDVTTRTCVTQCGTGYFSDIGDDECTRCTTCTSGKYRKEACTKNSDAVCATLKTCPAGQYVSSEPTSTTDRQCSNCDASKEYTSTANRDRCAAHTICEPGSFQSTTPSSSVNRVCTKCTAGTASTERNDLKCDVCDKGTFAAAAGATECDDCGLGMYNDVAGSTSCKKILPGFFGTGKDATERTGVSPCAKGFRCAGDDAEPVECKGTSEFQDETGKPTCKTAKDCQLAEYASKQPTTTSDRVCTSCPTGKARCTVAPISRTSSVCVSHL